MIAPDWSQVWTPAKAEHEFPSFKFVGIGWYKDSRHNDTVLVTDVGHGLYRFDVFNNRDPREELRKLADMQVHTFPFLPGFPIKKTN